MGIVARQKVPARRPVPAGNYFGVCVGVYDIGTQAGQKFGPRRQVVLQFELHRKKGPARDTEGAPLRIARFYNLAFNARANLRMDVERILDRTFSEAEAQAGFDIARLLGTVCRLTVAHQARPDGSVRDSIAAFHAPAPTDPSVVPEGASRVYELDPARPIPREVPDWIQRRIEASSEWQAARAGRPPAAEPTAEDRERSRNAAGCDQGAGWGHPTIHPEPVPF